MIVHVDMDAFYASVEERARPQLRGRPVIVGGNPSGRGVVSAANYVAREFGVRSAMPAATAARLCPNAVFLPPRISEYAAVSAQIHAIFDRFTPLVEPLALDEAFLDVRGSVGLFGSPVEIARQIKRTILDELELVASVGVAPNKFLAKVASDLEKPDGFVVVEPDRVQEFLDPLPVGRLWGAGRVAERTFQEMGIRTIGQLRRLSPDFLRDRWGASGVHLGQLARGVDDRAVVPDHEAKSISHETTFEVDIADRHVLRACLLGLTEQVVARLRAKNLWAGSVHLKVRYADFRTVTRTRTLPEPTNITQNIWDVAAQTLETRLPAHLPDVRLLGMGVGNLSRSPSRQRRLFDAEQDARRTALDAATDQIRARFGRDSIHRAGGEPP